MSGNVNWISFSIVGKNTYKQNEPIQVTGEIQTTMEQTVHLYLLFNKEGNWIEPPGTHDIITVATSKDPHTNNRTFNTSLACNNFYPLGKYKLVAKYAEVACPLEPQFDLTN